MKRIENHKYSIYEAFMECFYIVPDYQREYVWTEKKFTNFLKILIAKWMDLQMNILLGQF